MIQGDEKANCHHYHHHKNDISEKNQETSEVETLLDSSPVAQIAFDTIENASLSGYFASLCANKIISWRESDKFKAFAKTLELEQLPHNILSKLPEYLADDINKFLKEKEYKARTEEDLIKIKEKLFGIEDSKN